MLTDYIKAAMKRAKYKMIDDKEPFFGEIQQLKGVWANGPTLEACRDELEEALQSWIIVSLRLGHRLPVLDRIDLNPRLSEHEEVTQPA